MADVTIFHNPDCSTSRFAVDTVAEMGLDADIVLYRKTPPDAAALREIIAKLDDPPTDLAPLLRRDRIGFIFQSFNLVPTLSAIENITLPMDLARRTPDQTWLDTVIDTVGLRNRLTHRPNELSGGQQQRVAVARALASRPAIIFGDEPTGNLDSRTGAEILDFMRRAVTELGQTIVMVTHDPVAASYSDHVVFLADGRIVHHLDRPTPTTVLDTLKTLGD